MNSEPIKKFIERHSSLFWSIPEEKKKKISTSLLVETILNYGDEYDVKELFSLIGKDEVSKIFFKQTKNKTRHNYFPRTKHFFTLYFKKNV